MTHRVRARRPSGLTVQFTPPRVPPASAFADRDTVTVLGIESSCDETAAAVVRATRAGQGFVLADHIATQFADHAPYGGVVPEIASRAHLRAISPIVRQAIADAGGWEAIEAVAVTAGPGLIGALLVGLQAGKAIAYARSLPIVGVNHLAGHLLAPFLDRPLAIGTRPTFPFVALLASGGHTALYRVDDARTIRELGATRDDAAGEAFDKVAKLCGLGYPGGPTIDRLAQTGNPLAVKLPRPLRQRGSLEFSFSGLKTAVATHVSRHGVPKLGAGLEDLAASVQSAIVETLVRKLMAAVEQEHVHHVVISGGVAANRGLRAAATAACASARVELHVPPANSCTDNAAMIAYAGAVRLFAGEQDGLDLNARASWPLGNVVTTRKGAGADAPSIPSPRTLPSR